jgi:hypothetical protein
VRVYRYTDSGVDQLGTGDTIPNFDSSQTYRISLTSNPNGNLAAKADGVTMSTGYTTFQASINNAGFFTTTTLATFDNLSFSTPNGTVLPDPSAPSNTAPVVVVSGATSANSSTPVNLTSAITDSDAGDTHTYTWRVISGSATLSATDTQSVTVTPTGEGSVQIGLVVNDGTEDSAEDIHAIEFSNATVTKTINLTLGYAANITNFPIAIYNGSMSDGNFLAHDLIDFDSSGVASINVTGLSINQSDDALVLGSTYSGTVTSADRAFSVNATVE